MSHSFLLPLLIIVGCLSPAPLSQRPSGTGIAADSEDAAREDLPGGSTTVGDASPTAFGRAARNLSPGRWPELLEGKRLFQRNWATADAATGRAGLGPHYNGTSCADCHFRDGRGGPPTQPSPDVRLLGKLAVGGGAGPQAPEPTYGSQLSEHALPGIRREGIVAVDYQPQLERLLDGSVAELRRPSYRLEALSFGAVAPGLSLSVRMPGSLVGLGLLEAIPMADIVERADPDDRNGDGISGRANWVASLPSGELALGRFGWKAGQPTILQQIATALREDMGLTSWLRPHGACTQAQRNCAPRERDDEVSRRELQQLAHYVQLRGVPARRNSTDSDVRHGRQLFFVAGCASCHTPRHVTDAESALVELDHQIIFPYTDLLLHDMGDELADDVSEFTAEGREWRTPPLWGLGLLNTIHGRVRLLHDGRARGVEEAILWHGGEALRSRKSYMALALDERTKLARFIESL